MRPEKVQAITQNPHDTFDSDDESDEESWQVTLQSRDLTGHVWQSGCKAAVLGCNLVLHTIEVML